MFESVFVPEVGAASVVMECFATSPPNFHQHETEDVTAIVEIWIGCGCNMRRHTNAPIAVYRSLCNHSVNTV